MSKQKKLLKGLKVTKDLKHPEDDSDIVTLLSPDSDIFKSTESITELDLYSDKRDPVLQAKKRDQKKTPESTIAVKVSGPLAPSVSVRLDLGLHCPPVAPEQPLPRVKYIAPEKKEWKKAKEKKRQEFLDSLKFCEFDTDKVPSSPDVQELSVKLEAPSPDVSKAKVMPRKPSYEKDAPFPEPQEEEELEVHKPQSGIFINVKSDECLEETSDKEPTKVVRKTQKKKKKKSTTQFDETTNLLLYGEFEGEGEEWLEEDFYAEDEGEALTPGKSTQMSNEVLLTKYHKKVSQISASTEVNKTDLLVESLSWDQIPVISKIVQTIRLDQEARRPRKRIKHGTLESHSFTKLKQPILERFCFRTTIGSINYDDPNFGETSRGKQLICMAVAGFCYSKVKHPKNWSSITIDDVVEVGDQLYNQSIATLHMHSQKRELKAKELQKFVIIGEKKIRYQLDEPEIVGHVRSTDKRIYNMTKGLRIFFNRKNAGILITDTHSIALWRQNKKYLYMFDATPRAKDLYQDPKGAAVLAKFKCVKGVSSVLLERTVLENSVFSIYEIAVKKISNKNDIDDDFPIDESSKYNIINENKAVVKGTFDLSDKCFGFSRNKQALSMACVALVYSRISPPNSWHRKTIDKIMIIGNQLFLECQRTEKITEMRLENMPALFTIGPYIVNIYIFANRFVDLMFKKGQNCLLSCLEEFFQSCTNGIVDIGKHTLAIWKQRNMYYMFDPYSRNIEGLNCRSGTACVSMYSDVNALCDTVYKNFPEPDLLFRIHPLKVLKIHRDNELSRDFPKTMQMNDFPVEKFKCHEVKKSKKKAVEKPITVHLPGCAMKKLLAGESPGPSLISIASNVDSITGDILPKLPVIPPKQIPKIKISELGIGADLDSPSLSDTQIEPPRPKPFGEEEIGLMDLDSFKLTQEEKEMLGKGEGEGGEQARGGGDAKAEGEMASYFALNQRNQVRSGSLAPCVISTQVNTDVTYKYKILPALEYPPKWKKQEDKPTLDYICQRKAFDKKRNYKAINGLFQIVLGDKNIYDFAEDDDSADKVAPYIAIMAITLAQEFAPSKWHSKCIDFILRSGYELYSQHQDAYYKIEEFKIKFIRNEYKVTVDGIFDTYLGKDVFSSFQGHKTIEQHIKNELFDKCNSGIIVTPNYVVAVILYNNLYYVYEPYSAKSDGSCAEGDDAGFASIQRYKCLEALIFRFANSRLTILGDKFEDYVRFVLVRPTIERVGDVSPELKEAPGKTEELELTQSKELAKESNFVKLPDNSEIIRGTNNVAVFGEEVEYTAPFVCIMAAVVGQKYNVLTWSSEIVDFIIKYGAELYNESKVRFDQVPKLEIPKVSLGKTDYTISVNYLYDALMKQRTLEMALEKILYKDCDWGIFVTQTYSCAVFFNNFLYYMFDCFGCNEVGLGTGSSNTGFGCLNRFKDIHSMASRIMYNKSKRESQDQLEYSRFVVSVCKVRRIRPPPPKRKRRPVQSEEGEGGEMEEAFEGFEVEGDEAVEEEEEDAGAAAGGAKEKKNEVGYQFKNGWNILEGSKVLKDRATVTGDLKSDHFVCLCACLMVINHSIKKWDTKRMDLVLQLGQHIFSHATNLEVSPKRTVKNILMGRHFFDIIIKRIVIPTWRKNKNLDVGLSTVMEKRKFCIVQFPNCSYVVYKDEDGFHLYDPYGPPNPPPPKRKEKSAQQKKEGEDKEEPPKAAWVRFANDRQMKRQIIRNVAKGSESYSFYTFNVLSIRNAPKKVLISQRLALFDQQKQAGQELAGKPFNEHESWLDIHQSPWARSKNDTACGSPRGKPDTLWHNWDIEYPNDLYSLLGKIHQISTTFSPKTRGKQTLSNLVVAIGMTNIYDFPEWNSHVMDSILVNGDNYFKECIKNIKEPNHEVTVDDLQTECSIFPYSFQVSVVPVVQGTMFLENPKKFNLYKALRSFFDNYDNRCGIISATKGETKRFLAFGKLQEAEYFMYDCQAHGPPMFWERQGVAYVLRCLSLNRLIHCLVLTLKGGDFFIYDIETYNFQPMS